MVISDTHIPGRARDLPAAVWAAVDEADVVIHAGDWVSLPFFETVSERAARLVGVYGNNDPEPLRRLMPETARVELGGLRVAVIHDTGPAVGRDRRCAGGFADCDVLFFGHSHIPWDTTAPNGLRLLNPGSPTDRRRQPHATYLTAAVTDGRLRDVVLHRLPGRGEA